MIAHFGWAVVSVDYAQWKSFTIFFRYWKKKENFFKGKNVIDLQCSGGQMRFYKTCRCLVNVKQGKILYYITGRLQVGKSQEGTDFNIIAIFANISAIINYIIRFFVFFVPFTFSEQETYNDIFWLIIAEILEKHEIFPSIFCQKCCVMITL